MAQEKELMPAERLEAVLFQFVTLYERWAEDRQISAKQSADADQLVKKFTDQVETFKHIEVGVRYQLTTSVKEVITEASRQISFDASDKSKRIMDDCSKKLGKAAYDACQQLHNYQQEIKQSRLKNIALAVGSAVVAGLFLVWLLIPAPKLPLTNQQLNNLYLGYHLNRIFPQLSKQEQHRLEKLILQDGTNDLNNSEQ